MSSQLIRMLYRSCLLCLLLLASHAVVFAASVEKVDVTIVSSTYAPPPHIVTRMTASVGVVGERILLGKNVDDITTGQVAYETLIKEVFDRVLIGYSVQSVSLMPGSNTTIRVEVVPWGDVVQDVTVEVDGSNLSPEIIALIKKDIGNLEEDVNDLLIGLPVDAIDWAGGVSKKLIRDMLASELPEFTVHFEMTPGVHTVVTLSLVPAGDTVRDVYTSLRSQTLPNLLLQGPSDRIRQAGKNLRGLPVAFVQRHRAYFAEQLTHVADQDPIVKHYGVTVTPVLHPSVNTEIAIDADNDQYRVTIEGYMDMGRDTNNTMLHGHVGKFVNSRNEAFVEVDLFPNTMVWKWMPGWGYSLQPGTSVGIKDNLSDNQENLWFHQDINRNLSVELAHNLHSSQNELAIRYKLHAFLSAEYRVVNQDKWLRLVGSL